MGKSIIIHGADFSQVAVGKDDVTQNCKLDRAGSIDNLSNNYYAVGSAVVNGFNIKSAEILVQPSIITGGESFKYAYCFYNDNELNPDGTVAGAVWANTNYEGAFSLSNPDNKKNIMLQVSIWDSGNNPLGGVFAAADGADFFKVVY